MNSIRQQYLPIEQAQRSSWLPFAMLAAVSMGALVGLGLSTVSPDNLSLYAASTAKAIPTLQTQAVQMRAPTTISFAAQDAETLDSQIPESFAGREVDATSSPATGWASLALIPLAAVAGFLMGSRKTAPHSVPETFEVVIDDGEDDIAMAATTGLLGHKVGMTRIPDKNGALSPVTVIRMGPCVVTQIKTTATDGYEAIQVGFNEVRETKLTKPEKGHLAKSGSPPLKHLREYHVENASAYTPGQVLLADIFAEGDLVDVQGEIVGKGFMGPIRRWGFKRGLMTHGSKSHREPGSTGPGTTPGRVYPGSKGAGRVGGVTTIRKLSVVGIDTDQHLLMVKGSIPGPPGNLVSVKPSKVWGSGGPKTSLYAVVAIGGHQYIVQPGQILSVDKLPLQIGDEFTFEKVLLVKDGEQVDFGHPYLESAKVTAEVLRNSKGKKIRVFKYRAKKHYRLTKGHRQKYTDIHITEVAGQRVPSKVDFGLVPSV